MSSMERSSNNRSRKRRRRRRPQAHAADGPPTSGTYYHSDAWNDTRAATQQQQQQGTRRHIPPDGNTRHLPNGQSRPITMENMENAAQFLSDMEHFSEFLGALNRMHDGDNECSDDDDDDDSVMYTAYHDRLPEMDSLSWQHRWKHHLLLRNLTDMSLFLQGGPQMIHQNFEVFLLGFVFVIPLGVIMGGFAVGVVEWIIDNVILVYLPYYWLVYLVKWGVILGGPEILPPLTLVNGCEELLDRLFWVLIFSLLDVVASYFDEDSCLAYKSMMIASAIWHMDRGDHHFKAFALQCQRNQNRAFENNNNETLNSFAFYQFRAASGVGMLWAVFGVYSLGTFFKASLLFVAVILAIPFVFGSNDAQESRQEHD